MKTTQKHSTTSIVTANQKFAQTDETPQKKTTATDRFGALARGFIVTPEGVQHKRDRKGKVTRETPFLHLEARFWLHFRVVVYGR